MVRTKPNINYCCKFNHLIEKSLFQLIQLLYISSLKRSKVLIVAQYVTELKKTKL